MPAFSATRDALLQLPHRLAPVLAAETEMERVSQLLDIELRLKWTIRQSTLAGVFVALSCMLAELLGRRIGWPALRSARWSR